MLQATKFIFGPYRADWRAGKLDFDYAIEFEDSEALEFTEKIEFAGGAKSFDAILPHLSLMLGISYYKLYVPPKIELPYQLTEDQAQFWNTVYRKGLGEFWYRNGLEPRSPFLNHPVSPPKIAYLGGSTTPSFSRRGKQEKGALLGIGGGKDSIVAAELLKKEGMNVAGFVVETERGSQIIEEVVKALEIPVLKIRRTLDPKLFQPHSGSYNGHVPVSAIYAWLGLLLAVWHDMGWVAVGNEFSSDFGNLEYKGEVINHQWSKSSEFEKMFQEYVKGYITHDVTYFSLLRAFHEIRVVKQLVNLPIWNSIKSKFSSCNRNFVHHSSSWPASRSLGGGWCGECPKCAFVFAMLAAFLPKKEVIKVFGKNLYADKNLVETYRDLLGMGGLKPFDCLGTFAETRGAMWAAREKFSEDIVLQELVKKIKDGEKAWKEVMRVQTAPTLPERFRLAGMARVLILGYGREGKVTEQFLRKYYPDIEIGIADQKEGRDYLDKQSNFDIAIKTPGIPRRFVTIPYTTATNIFFSRVSNLTIGVTGSKGKSTTASLIAAMLAGGGKKVQLLGNIGKPMLEALLKPPHPRLIYVIELSSQQLEDLTISPNIAVITTLFPEHMDYHGSIEAYYEAKKNIFRFQKPDDVFLQNRPSIPVPGSEIPLAGEHNRQNIRAAVAVAKHLGIPDEVIARAIRDFKPLPHRLELVGEFRGIRFYDNASSTTPESTIEGLKAISNVGTIFLGGLDRGYDFRDLISEIQKKDIQNAVLFPDTGARILKLLPARVKILETASMEKAVKFAYAHTPAGKTVLLSAASPSYSLWANFNEQGDEFKKWVKAFA